MNDNNNNNEEEEQEQEIIKDFMAEEKDRSHTNLNRQQKEVLMKNVKLSKRLAKEINKAFRDLPNQRLAVAQSTLFEVIVGILSESTELEYTKKTTKLSVLAQLARIIAMISCYPDSHKYEGFRKLTMINYVHC